MKEQTIPDWVIYPEKEWETITPEEAGFDESAWQKFLKQHQVGSVQWEGKALITHP